MSDAFLHSLLEFIASLLCFAIAGMAWHRYRKVASGLNALWCVSFLLVGILESLHAGLSLLDPSLVDYWVPWSWGVARAVLAAMFLMAIRFADYAGAKVWKPAAAFGILVSVILFPWGEQFSFVYSDEVIKRVFDFGLMFVWAIVWIVFEHSPKAKAQMPAHVPRLFFALAIAVHFIMAFFSAKSLDAGFMVAHVLKDAELLCWLLCAVFELRASHTHTEGLSGVYHGRGEVLIKEADEELQELRKAAREGFKVATARYLRKDSESGQN